ncbi:MAG: hypothetical protein U9N82_11435 [Thermodesulfobacteriota bacterium]|nr:hypothetical protein [Thermodesulfobacteriota bacterium]
MGEDSKNTKVAQTHKTQELAKADLKSKKKAESTDKLSPENTVESSLPPFDTMNKQRGSWSEVTPPVVVPDSLRKLNKLFKNSNIVILSSSAHAKLLPFEIIKFIKEDYEPWDHANSHISALLKESREKDISQENEPQELKSFRNWAGGYHIVVMFGLKYEFKAFKGYYNPIFPGEYYLAQVYEYQKDGERRYLLMGEKGIKDKKFESEQDVLGDSLLNDPIYEGKTVDELVREAIKISYKNAEPWLRIRDELKGFMLAKCQLREISGPSIKPSSMFIHPDLRTIALVYKYIGGETLSPRSKLKFEFKNWKTKGRYTGYHPTLDKVGPQVAFVTINDKAFVETILNGGTVTAKIGLVN